MHLEANRVYFASFDCGHRPSPWFVRENNCFTGYKADRVANFLYTSKDYRKNKTLILGLERTHTSFQIATLFV
jgi:hypothetical protein